MNTDEMNVKDLLMLATHRIQQRAREAKEGNPTPLDVQEVEHLAEMSKLFCKIVSACDKRIEVLHGVKTVRTSKPVPTQPKAPVKPAPAWPDSRISAAVQRYLTENKLTHYEFRELVAAIPSSTLSNRINLVHPWRKSEIELLVYGGVLPAAALEGR